VIVSFVDISGIDDNHCLNSLHNMKYLFPQPDNDAEKKYTSNCLKKK